jgi:hypothetical protein
VHFDLPRPIPVLPDRQYRIELISSQIVVGWSYPFSNPMRDFYPRGDGYDCGRRPYPSRLDFAFITYTGASAQPPPPPPPPTPPAPPPPPPPPAPPQYGVVAQASISRVGGGLAATFVFRTLPVLGARLKTTWLYNNRRVGEARKPRARIVTSIATASRGLPRGFYRCQLKVKLRGRPWRTVKEARTRLR